MKMDNTSIAIFIFTSIYWIYLLDPFKSKPQNRRYKKILHDKTTLISNSSICLVLAVLGTIRIIGFQQHDFIALTPLLFIIFLFCFNFVSRKLYARDLHLIIRGDMLKASFFDYFASVFIIIIPFVLSIILTGAILKS